MESINAIASLLFGGITAFGVLFNVWQIWLTKREAVAAAMKAQSAALEASNHARIAAAGVAEMADNVQKIETATNNIVTMAMKAKDEAGVAAASEARVIGREEGRVSEVERSLAERSEARREKK